MLTVITLTGRSTDVLDRFWQGSAPLTATGLLMIAALGGGLIGLAVDPRTVTGAPAWLKPAKFAASIALYTFTLAWIFSLIPTWARTRRTVGWTTAVAMVLEIVVISVQAFRGRASHFNVATPVDGMLFTIMGVAIMVQTLSTVAVWAALWRARLADRALGWALRLGMTITIVGALMGGLMAQPTREQLDAARAGEPMTVAGAHTVGAPDGGPGLPGTGWSTDHGDLRIPHFLGLHALQVLPMVALVLARRRVSDGLRVRLTVTAAGSYVALFGILLSQALRGQSVFAPDALTIALLGLWVLGTLAAAVSSIARSLKWRRAERRTFDTENGYALTQ
jgi:hypothetical protein